MIDNLIKDGEILIAIGIISFIVACVIAGFINLIMAFGNIVVKPT